MAKQSKSTDSTSTKKPLVNWFSREKSKSERDSAGVKTMSKTVTAPESILSRGFSKTKTSKSVEKPLNDTLRYSSDENLRFKIKNKPKTGSTEKIKSSVGKSFNIYDSKNNKNVVSRDESFTRKLRNPSKGLGGVEKTSYYLAKDDSTFSDYETKRKTPSLKAEGKTPTTNWANREKSLRKDYFQENTKNGTKNMVVKNKKTTTPKSKMSSGFEKTIYKKSKKGQGIGLEITGAGATGLMSPIVGLGGGLGAGAAMAGVGAGMMGLGYGIKALGNRKISKDRTKKRTK
jgi:hypothetical protein